MYPQTVIKISTAVLYSALLVGVPAIIFFGTQKNVPAIIFTVAAVFFLMASVIVFNIVIDMLNNRTVRAQIANRTQ